MHNLKSLFSQPRLLGSWQLLKQSVIEHLLPVWGHLGNGRIVLDLDGTDFVYLGELGFYFRDFLSLIANLERAVN